MEGLSKTAKCVFTRAYGHFSYNAIANTIGEIVNLYIVKTNKVFISGLFGNFLDIHLSRFFYDFKIFLIIKTPKTTPIINIIIGNPFIRKEDDKLYLIKNLSGGY